MTFLTAPGEPQCSVPCDLAALYTFIQLSPCHLPALCLCVCTSAISSSETKSLHSLNTETKSPWVLLGKRRGRANEPPWVSQRRFINVPFRNSELAVKMCLSDMRSHGHDYLGRGWGMKSSWAFFFLTCCAG